MVMSVIYYHPLPYFKVCISKAEDGDTDDSDESDSEVTDNSSDEDEEEEGIPKPEDPEMQVGVTPFLTGVLPAGRLRARKKQPACPAVGLIQVGLLCSLYLDFSLVARHKK